MATFTYTARTATGDIQSGEREAKSRDELVNFLRGQRMTPVKIEEKAKSSGRALAGLASKLVSAASTPEADTRAWDNLPRYLSFACLPLPPGKHVMTVEFKDAAGKVAANLTKTVNFEIPPGGGDKVIFISDQSSTPQTI